MHEKMIELGMESPWAPERLDRAGQDDRITTRVEIAEYNDVRSQALLAHATQIDPTSAFWFGLPPEVAKTVHPYDDYILARSLVETTPPEDDLFAGIRDMARRS